jgi:hypothetical protein
MQLPSAISKFFLAFCATLFAAGITFADTPVAVISANDTVKIGKMAEFEATHSYNSSPELPVFYSWDFGDSWQETGEKVKHTYAKPGVFPVSLTMKVGGDVAKQNFELFVYEKSILLLTDNRELETQIQTLAETARSQNFFLDTAWGIEAREGFFANEGLITTTLQGKFSTLQETDLIVLWLGDSEGLNSLTRFAKELNPPLDFSQKRIVVVSGGDLDKLARIARGAFASLQPAEIILTREDALRDSILIPASENLGKRLETQAIPYRLVDSGVEKFSITAPLSFCVNYLIAQGIPASVILLVLLLPVIATFVAFMKQVVGINTFGVYTPSVLTLSFLAVGLKLGLTILAVVVLGSILARRILRGRRLAYTPRLAIILSIVSLAILTALVLLVWLAPFGNYQNIPSLIATSIFPVLIMSTLAEEFVSIQSEKGSSSAVRLTLEVILVSVICYFVVGEWSYLHTLVLSTPEVIFLFIVADVILGRFTGLRFTEYIRFRAVINSKHEEEE